MKYRALLLAAALTACSNSQATILGFGQLGGNNTTIPKNFGSRATADGNGVVVSNGSTPNIEIAWDVNGQTNNGNPASNGWDIHTSTNFTTLEGLTAGGGAWDDEGAIPRVGQLDFGIHTIGFAVDPGAQLVLNSFDFAHTAETAGNTAWDLKLTDSATNTVWSQAINFTNGMAVTVSPSFIGLEGEDYTLTFTRTSESYASNGRHGIDNLSFNQLPDLSNPIGSLVINRSGTNAGTASIQATQAFSFSEYEIRSTVGALNPEEWNSITESGADPTDGWSILNSTPNSLREQDGPTGPNNGLALTAGGQFDLGQAFSILPTFRRDGTTPTNWEDAGFTIYDPSGSLLAVTPTYTGTPVPWGDYNGDLSIDILDWPLFRAGYSGNYTGMSAIEAYLGGDLDGDFDSDIHDFNIFVDLAGGMGALFGTQVPEPSSVALIALAGVVVWAGRRVRGAAALAVLATVALGSTAEAQSQLHFTVAGSTPVTSIPATQQNENANTGPEKMFDDAIVDEAGHVDYDLFFTNYTSAQQFPTGFLGQYAMGAETPGQPDSAVVFMDYGSPISANWFAYSQRTGNNPVADKVGKFEFWFSNTDFAGTAPTTTPDAVFQLQPGDNRINDSLFRPYTLSGDHSGRYVAMRITETAASGALNTTSRIGGHEFRLLQGPSDVVLTVDRSNGAMTLRNNLSGAANIDMNSYTIESVGGALNTSAFNGLRGDAMFSLGNGSGNGWELADNLNPNRLAEAYFTSETTLNAGTGPISLGNAYNNLSGIEDLVFLWSNTAGEVYNARVEYIGTAPGQIGDYNDDGIVNLADYTVWRDNLGASITLPNDSTPGTVTAADYTVWKSNFGAGSPLVGAVASATVPEPSSLLVAISAIVGLIAGVRHRSKITKA
ncbi:PEP-CTERM sorting domain-containing protein [Aeoliella sp. SH292]|uniref:PEP-CTERM sorting domain-containing protein n=1 Tax=Aeoliella sp. SH292 TaxID=3454464 RepID=UPI003F9787A4